MFPLRKICQVKNIAISNICRLVHYAPKEVSISVPWGKVAGLHWNPSSSAIPIICIHGWKDNAASFNKIIPAILSHTSNYQFLSVDLPGHGFSDRFPDGMLYTILDNLILIRRIMKSLDWPEESNGTRGIRLFGHSLGAMLGFIFAATHPKLVHSLIAIDALVPMMFAKPDNISNITATTQLYLYMESKEFKEKRSKTCTKNEIMKKMFSSHMCGIDKCACEELATRAIVESPSNSGRYKFSHDPRVQFYPLTGYSAGQVAYLSKCFESNLLHVKAEHGVHYVSDFMEESIKQWIQMSNKGIARFIKVEKAAHHVHLMEPEKVVNDIVDFLNVVR